MSLSATAAQYIRHLHRPFLAYACVCYTSFLWQFTYAVFKRAACVSCTCSGLHYKSLSESHCFTVIRVTVWLKYIVWLYYCIINPVGRPEALCINIHLWLLQLCPEKFIYLWPLPLQCRNSYTSPYAKYFTEFPSHNSKVLVSFIFSVILSISLNFLFIFSGQLRKIHTQLSLTTWYFGITIKLWIGKNDLINICTIHYIPSVVNN